MSYLEIPHLYMYVSNMCNAVRNPLEKETYDECDGLKNLLGILILTQQ